MALPRLTPTFNSQSAQNGIALVGTRNAPETLQLQACINSVPSALRDAIAQGAIFSRELNVYDTVFNKTGVSEIKFLEFDKDPVTGISNVRKNVTDISEAYVITSLLFKYAAIQNEAKGAIENDVTKVLPAKITELDFDKTPLPAYLKNSELRFNVNQVNVFDRMPLNVSDGSVAYGTPRGTFSLAQPIFIAGNVPFEISIQLPVGAPLKRGEVIRLQLNGLYFNAQK